jgi:hypothetical protein
MFTLDVNDSKSAPEDTSILSPTPPRAENRHATRENLSSLGGLAYGGEEPRVLSCEVLDISETGVRVETYVHPVDIPEFVSLTFGGRYYRARRCWVEGNQIGLELIPDEA